jgi:rod shape-determining protein MreC
MGSWLKFIEQYRHLSLLVAVLLAQLFLLAFQIRGENDVRLVRVWAVALVTPLERTVHSIGNGMTTLWENYVAVLQARQESRRLEAELEQARLRVQELEAQSADVERLATLLELKQSSYGQAGALVAEVIGASAAPSARSLFLNRGRDAGLEPNRVVVTPEGVVGRLLTVFSEASQVLLLTDTRSGVGAMTADSRILGVLKGTGASTCRLEYVPNDEPIAPGTELITSGQDQVYPRGLPLGRVMSARPGDFFQEVIVQPRARLTRLDYVFVLLRSAEIVGREARGPEVPASSR